MDAVLQEGPLTGAYPDLYGYICFVIMMYI